VSEYETITADEWEAKEIVNRDIAYFRPNAVAGWVEFDINEMGVTPYVFPAQPLVALALHGQLFGFTREDVEAVFGNAAMMENDASIDEMLGRLTPEDKEFTSQRVARLRSLASRIEALLPPE
jgi:hypothetical protein